MISDWIKIDGQRFDVKVLDIIETATILYSDKTGRTISVGARMNLDALGTFIGHKVTVARNGNNFKDYDRLYNYVIKPRNNGLRIKAVHDQKTIDYEGYISTAERQVKRIDDDNSVVYWNQMELNIIPMEAQVLPE